jgi:dCMP deaminase
MTEAVIAYVPVLHDGYRRFLERHAAGKPLYLIGTSLYEDYRPLAKDIRALPAELVRPALAAWGICSTVEVLEVAGAEALAAQSPSLILPAEDVSYQVVEQFFSRCPVRYDTVFLRWDKTRTAQLLLPAPSQVVQEDEAIRDLCGAAEEQALLSLDWWRRVGAAIRLATGEVLAGSNQHEPHRLSAYTVGDPRSNFYKGVHLELSTAVHAEAALVAAAARRGASTSGAVAYVTDFPCPPCAKLLAGAGITRLYFRAGYAVLDGQEVLERAGVEIMQISSV